MFYVLLHRHFPLLFMRYCFRKFQYMVSLYLLLVGLVGLSFGSILRVSDLVIAAHLGYLLMWEWLRVPPLHPFVFQYISMISQQSFNIANIIFMQNTYKFTNSFPLVQYLMLCNI